MKKLQVMIDDDLMKEAKLRALLDNTTLKDIVALALSEYLYITTTESIKVSNDVSTTTITSNTKIQESNDVSNTTNTSIKESFNPFTDSPTSNTKEPKTHFHRATHLLGQETPEFVYETRYDENGEPYTVQLVNPEFLYGKVEKIENPPYDLNDPLEKKLAEMEAKYKY